MSFHEAIAAPSRKNRASGVPRQAAAPGLMIQRKCSCGSHAMGGECDGCKKKRGPMLLRRERGQVDPVTPLAGSEATLAARRPGPERDLSGLTLRDSGAAPALRTARQIQRQPLLGGAEATRGATPAPVPSPGPAPGAMTSSATSAATSEATPEAAPEASAETPTSAPSGSLLAEDGATDLLPGQLRKSEFLDQLHTAVCAEAEAALAGTEHSTSGCPYLAYWFAYYRAQSSQQVEGALRRYAPEARSARTASEYIPIVAARVRQGVERWASTGEVTGVPADAPRPVAMQGAGEESTAEADGAEGDVLRKTLGDGARAKEDPVAVRAELGAGQPLEHGVRSRMESAFGRSFAHVRAHTDTTASRLSSEQTARAFTVGEHVAFGGNEYRPGTVIGDALIAHELAHVVQQGGASEATQAQSTSSATYGALERDADDAAIGAVMVLWGRAKGGLTNLPNALPRVGSGLRLQRCGATRQATRTPTTTPSTSAGPSASAGLTCQTGERTTSAPDEARGRSLDPRAQAIINGAQDTSRPIDVRAVAVVEQIICQYFPTDAEKVNSVRYVEDRSGLDVTTARDGSVIRGDVEVGRDFVQNTTERHFARRVLQVRHELQHIDQWRAGMTGAALSGEREFLAFHREALGQELPETGRMQHSTRVALIDGALGYYYCLSSDKQREYQPLRDELLDRRPTEERAGGPEHTEPPTECSRQ